MKGSSGALGPGLNSGTEGCQHKQNGPHRDLVGDKIVWPETKCNS